jgi:hypothetical protein
MTDETVRWATGERKDPKPGQSKLFRYPLINSTSIDRSQRSASSRTDSTRKSFQRDDQAWQLKSSVDGLKTVPKAFEFLGGGNLPQKGAHGIVRSFELEDVDIQHQRKLLEGETLKITYSFPERGLRLGSRIFLDDQTSNGQDDTQTEKRITEYYKKLEQRNAQYRRRIGEVLREVGIPGGGKGQFLVAAGNEERAAEALDRLFEDRDEAYVKEGIMKDIEDGVFLGTDEEINNFAANNKEIRPTLGHYGIETRSDIDNLSPDELEEMCLKIWGSRLVAVDVLAADSTEARRLREETESRLEETYDELLTILGEGADQLRLGQKINSEIFKKFDTLIKEGAVLRSSFNSDRVEETYQKAKDLLETLKTVGDELANKGESLYTKGTEEKLQYLASLIKSQSQSELTAPLTPLIETKSTSIPTTKNEEVASSESTLPPLEENNFSKLTLPNTIDEVDAIIDRSLATGNYKYIELGLAAKKIQLARLEGTDSKEFKELDEKLNHLVEGLNLVKKGSHVPLEGKLEMLKELSYQRACDRFGWVDEYVDDDGTVRHPLKEVLDRLSIATAANRPVNIYLYGKAGGGKTTLPKIVAQMMNGDCEVFQCDRDLSRIQLKGDKGLETDGKGGTRTIFEPGQITSLAQQSHKHYTVTVFDEANLADETVWKGNSQFFEDRSVEKTGIPPGNPINSPVFFTANQSGTLLEDQGLRDRVDFIEISKMSKNGMAEGLKKNVKYALSKLKLSQDFALQLANFYDDMYQTVDSGKLSTVGGHTDKYPSFRLMKKFAENIAGGMSIRQAVRTVIAPNILGNVPDDQVDRQEYYEKLRVVNEVADNNFRVSNGYSLDSDITHQILASQRSVQSSSKSSNSQKSRSPTPTANTGTQPSPSIAPYGIEALSESQAKKRFKTLTAFPGAISPTSQTSQNFTVINDPKNPTFHIKSGRGWKQTPYIDNVTKQGNHNIGVSTALRRTIRELADGVLVKKAGQGVYEWIPSDLGNASAFHISIEDLEGPNQTIKISGISQDNRGGIKTYVDSRMLAAITAAVVSEGQNIVGQVPTLPQDPSKMPMCSGPMLLCGFLKKSTKGATNLQSGKDKLLQLAKRLDRTSSRIDEESARLHNYLYHGLKRVLSSSTVLLDNSTGVRVEKISSP